MFGSRLPAAQISPEKLEAMDWRGRGVMMTGTDSAWKIHCMFSHHWVIIGKMVGVQSFVT
jgi:hypothetical protein